MNGSSLWVMDSSEPPVWTCLHHLLLVQTSCSVTKHQQHRVLHQAFKEPLLWLIEQLSPRLVEHQASRPLSLFTSTFSVFDLFLWLRQDVQTNSLPCPNGFYHRTPFISRTVNSEHLTDISGLSQSGYYWNIMKQFTVFFFPHNIWWAEYYSERQWVLVSFLFLLSLLNWFQRFSNSRN